MDFICFHAISLHLMDFQRFQGSEVWSPAQGALPLKKSLLDSSWLLSSVHRGWLAVCWWAGCCWLGGRKRVPDKFTLDLRGSRWIFILHPRLTAVCPRQAEAGGFPRWGGVGNNKAKSLWLFVSSRGGMEIHHDVDAVWK